MVSNATFAPFDKAGFFSWFAEAAKEFLDNNDCTNDLPILSLDHNDGVLSSPEHMAQTWEPLRGCSTFLTKGEKIKAARWFQFNRGTRDVLSTASSLLLMIATWSVVGSAAGDEEDGRRPEGAPGNEACVRCWLCRVSAWRAVFGL